MEAYQTQNLSLAATLATLGCSFYKTADGLSSPVINVYERANLLEVKGERPGEPYYKGWKIDDAARDAHRRGIPGTVSFSFAYSDELAEIVRAFDAQKELMRECAKRDEDGAAPAGEIEIEFGAAARFACQLLVNRKTLRDAWKEPVPMVCIRGETSRRPNAAGGTELVGSFKLYSLNASPKTRERLGIK